MSTTPPHLDHAVERRRAGLSRIGAVTAATALGAGGVTLAVAAGLAVSHADAAASSVTTSGGSGSDSGVSAAASPDSGGSAASPTAGTTTVAPPGDTGRPAPPAGGLAPGQGNPQAQSLGS